MHSVCMSRTKAITKTLSKPTRSVMEKPTMCLMGKVAQPAAPCRAAAELGQEASIHLARNLFISELPGAAFSLITLIYVVTRLIGLM